MDKQSATPRSDTPAPEAKINPETTVVEEPAGTMVVEATPVNLVTPEPSPAATDPTLDPTQTVAPTDNTVLIQPPKKKFSLAAIIGFVVFGLLLIGGIAAAVWYFAVYQNPQNVAFDAINNFLTAEHVQTEGDILVKLTQKESAINYDDDYVEGTVTPNEKTFYEYTVKLDNKSRNLPNATTATLNVRETDEKGNTIEDHSLSIDLGSVVLSDGAIYFQVSNLAEAVSAIIDESYFDTTVGQTIYEVIEAVDGEWWKISIPEIIDELNLGSSAQPLKNLYSCIITASNKSHSDEIAGYYRAHQFVNVEKAGETDGVGVYDVTLDYDTMADFLNELPHSGFSEDVTACYNTYARATGQNTVSPDDADKITAADIRDELPENLMTSLKISKFGHQLEGVSIAITDSDNDYPDFSFIGTLNFTYEAATVEAPASYRPITELVDKILDAIGTIFMGGLDYDYDYDYDDDYGYGDYFYYDDEGDYSAFDSNDV